MTTSGQAQKMLMHLLWVKPMQTITPRQEMWRRSTQLALGPTSHLVRVALTDPPRAALGPISHPPQAVPGLTSRPPQAAPGPTKLLRAVQEHPNEGEMGDEALRGNGRA